MRVSGLAFVLAALLGATKRARRSSKRSTAPTNTAILTIGIHGAHKPHDNRLPNQESPPNREPRGTARGAADVCRGSAHWMPPTMAASASLPNEPPDPNRRDRTRRLAAQSTAGHTDRYPAGNSLRRQHNGPQRPNANPLAQRPTADAAASIARRTNKRPTDTTAHDARTRTPRHNRTRQAAASMVRQTNKRLTDTTAHNARRRRLTSHEHTTLLRRGTNAADLADSSPASEATGEQRHRRAQEAECPYQAKRSPAHRACGAFTPPQ